MTLDNRIPQIIERVDLVDLVSRYGGAQAGSERAGTVTFHCPNPSHADTNPSFTVNVARGTWKCWSQCDTGGDAIDLLLFLNVASSKHDAIEMLASEAGIARTEPPTRARVNRPRVESKQVGEWFYSDEDSNPVSKVVRYEPGRDGRPKSFAQFSLDGAGNWMPGLNGARRLLYRLPQTLAAVREGKRWIFVLEGEGKTERAIEALGIVATTCAEGSGKFTDEHARSLAGAFGVAVIGDNDEPGRKHALGVASKVYGIAQRVRIIELPDLPEKGDIVEWIEAGGKSRDLKALLDATPDWTPPADTDPTTNEEVGDKEVVPNRRPVSLRLSDVEAEHVSWLWPRYIPLGKITVIDGDPKLGKSTVATDIGARVTIGSPMPDGSRADLDGPADVILVSAEDGAADTIRPRADAAGADTRRIHLLTDVAVRGDNGVTKLEPWMMPRDLDMLRVEIIKHGAKMVVLDPLSAVVDKSVNMYVDQDVRGALRPLKDIAESTGCAIVVVRHLSKSSGSKKAIYAGGGSIGIVGAARAALLVALDPDDPSEKTRIVAPNGGNLGPEPTAMRYELVASDDEENETARVKWLGESHHKAGALLAQPETDDQRSEREEIADIITELTIGGVYPYQEAVKKIRAAGYDPSPSTIRRAIQLAGCKTDPPGGFGDKRSIRRLSGGSSQSSQPPQSPFDGTGDATGLTRENVSRTVSPVTTSDVTGLEAVAPLDALVPTASTESPALGSDLIVREDANPSDLIGLPKMALIRHRANVPLTPEDENALIGAGVATRSVN